MIAGVVTHSGDIALAKHLLGETNSRVTVTCVNSIPSGSVAKCLMSLRLLASGCRTRRPLAHAHASPSRTYTEGQLEEYWSEFEREFGLEYQPFFEMEHVKIGANRVAHHRHRVYLRVTEKGKAIGLNQSFPRSERISRWAEFTNGERFTKGRLNLAVAKALHAAGRSDIADAMGRAGLLDGAVPIATKPSERQMIEAASDISQDEVARRIWRAWRQSDRGAAGARDGGCRAHNCHGRFCRRSRHHTWRHPPAAPSAPHGRSSGRRKARYQR
jgi:hypothetical protein